MKDVSKLISRFTPEQLELLQIRLGGKPPVSPQSTFAPIPKIARNEGLPLSPAQERFWFLNSLKKESAAYVFTTALRLQGRLDVAALESSFEALLDRHEILRTVYRNSDGQLFQVISLEKLAVVQYAHLKNAESDLETAVNQLAKEEARRPFDLSHDVPLRATLLRRTETDHVLILCIHHIAFDGWSTSILFRDLSALYEAAIKGLSPALPELPVQFADYAKWWSESGLQNDRGLVHYWLRTLAGMPSLLEVPADRPRPEHQTWRGSVARLVIAKEFSELLYSLAHAHSCTLFMVLLAAFQTLLHRYTRETDICVGSPVAHRPHQETQELIGPFINTLVMRTNLSGDPTFSQVLVRVKETVLGAYDHQTLPFARLLAILRPDRHLSHSPLIQVLFQLRNYPATVTRLHQLNVSIMDIQPGTAQFDLALDVTETESGLQCLLNYSEDLFERATAQRMLAHLQNLIEAATANPDRCISRLVFLSAKERRQALYEWNETEVPYPRDKCIHDLFAEQVRIRPDKTAVVFADQELSYQELNEKSREVALYLQGQGVKPDSLVAVCMERSVEMVVGLLGILQAGGAYVPLDPEYPEKRLAYMLWDSGAKIVLTQEKLQDKLRGSLPANTQLITVDRQWLEIVERVGCLKARNVPLHQQVQPHHLAYVIYTSGSTGTPKGVMIEHRSVYNHILWQCARFGFGPEDRFLQRTSISFDASVWELWTPLAIGARLVLLPPDAGKDPAAIAQTIRDHRITLVQFVPSLLQATIQQGPPFRCRYIFCGGEPLSTALVQEARSSVSEGVVNLYGPTEATIDATAWSWNGAVAPDNIPIGIPIANTQIYILDQHNNVQPVGVPGELCIAGDGLARGYLNRAELTEEKFVANPFQPGKRMYKTGDLARWLEDGTIQYLRRIDTQVKVRGYRIELGEIEAQLLEHRGVEKAAVVAREDVAGEKRLVAYYTGRKEEGGPGKVPDAQSLRRYLQARLPEYMVPAAYVRLERMPLTENGKLDRKGLPLPGVDAYAARRYEAPQGEVETKLAEIWAEVLKVERVGRQDNFFELGGHSLLAVQVVSRIRKVFGVELPVRRIFEQATLAQLARGMEVELRGGTLQAGAVMERSGRQRLPLSFAQQRLFFLQHLEPESWHYNVPVLLRLRGEVKEEALEWALNGIVQRHEVLRTRFAVDEGGPVQIIQTEERLRLQAEDLGGVAEEEREAEVRRRVRGEVCQTFDLGRGGLLRALLLHVSEEEHVLLLNMHHIVSDAWSMEVLAEEMGVLYEACRAGREPQLPELPVQYGDFAVWQRRWMEGEEWKQQLEYWRKQLQGAAVLELPLKGPRPAVQSHTGAKHYFDVSGEAVKELREIGRQEGVTLFMTLLAAFKVLLSRYSGQTDVVVGTPISGRNRAEVEGLIGFFLNTLVLRSDLSGRPDFRQLLRRVREVALGGYAHQELPFEKLVEELQPERDMGRSPLFQVAFVLQHTPREWSLPGMKLSSMEVETGSAKFDLTLLCREVAGGGLRGALEYSTDLFAAEAVARMADHFQVLLAGIVADPQTRITELPLLREEERQQVVEEWNRTEREYGREKSVAEVFAAQVARTPEAIAVECGEQRLSYRELDERANRLAHYLRRRAVREEVPVGVCLERSLEMVVVIVAVVKAGGAYVPLDAGYPERRLAFMMKDAGVRVLVSEAKLRSRLPEEAIGEQGIRVVSVDGEREKIACENSSSPVGAVGGEGLVYVMYTSGSTGEPKGVGVVQRNVIRLVRNTNYAEFGEQEVFLQMAPVGFDASTFEIWGALLNGGRLVVAEGEKPGVEELGRQLRGNGVTTLWMTAGLFQMMVEEKIEDLRGVRQLLAGGDVLSVGAVRKVVRELPKCRMINGYGPTEGTTFSCCHWLKGEEEIVGSVPLGRAISNSRAYVLDGEMNPVPVGVVGELYIGGAGLARGYWGRAGLTAEKFVPDGVSGRWGERLYRSGDLVRWRSEGVLEYLGRMDQQVKVRGYRVELGEIEAVLGRHGEVEQCVVVAKGDSSGEKWLVGYVVGKKEATAGGEGSGRGEEQGINRAKLREYLKERLPEYMVPGVLVEVEQLPLTPNGKVDRRRLPEVERRGGEERGEEQGLGTPVEELLGGIWSEVLKVERVRAEDNFFELGGHSLLAMQVVSRIGQLLHVEVPLRASLLYPVLREFAAYIEELRASGSNFSAIESVPHAAMQTPSMNQDERLLMEWLNHLQGTKAPPFQHAIGVFFDDEPDCSALEQALNEIIRRHEILRSAFPDAADLASSQEAELIEKLSRPDLLQSGLFSLQIHPEARLSIKRRSIALGEHESPESRLVKAAAEETQRPLVYRQPPLMRALLLESARAHLLVIILHHLVSDRWSLGVLQRELQVLYKYFAGHDTSSALPELAVQYLDFASWQRKRLSGKLLQETLSYWERHWQEFSSAQVQSRDLLFVRPEPKSPSFSSGRETLVLDQAFAATMRGFARKHNVTLYMLSLSAMYILFHAYTRRNRVALWAYWANRARPELQSLIGWISTTHLLGVNISPQCPVPEFLAQVREVVLEASLYQEMPHASGIFLAERGLPRQLHLSDLYISFDFVGATPAERWDLGNGLTGRQASLPSKEVGSSLEFVMTDTGKELSLVVRYAKDTFAAADVQDLLQNIRKILEGMFSDTQAPVSSLCSIDAFSAKSAIV